MQQLSVYKCTLIQKCSHGHVEFKDNLEVYTLKQQFLHSFAS